MFFVSIAQAAETKLNVGVKIDAWHAIIEASPVVKLTLLLLVFMSVISWAIIFSKRRQLKVLEGANAPFLDLFWRANSLDHIFSELKHYPKSSLARVFKSGYLELRKMADSRLADKGQKENTLPMLSGIDNLERALRVAIDNELSQLETRLTFLATTGSTGPFIGLFGTVWGIMGAFQKIGATNMASLAVVAPGISEALIATAIGLAAAIPASVGYNHFLNRVRKQELELNNFASDFLNVAKRNFFRDR